MTNAEVTSLVNYFVQIWEKSSETPPRFSKCFPQHEQLKRETHLEKFLEFLQKADSTKTENDIDKEKALDNFLAELWSFARHGLNFSETSLDTLFSRGFPKLAIQFAREARHFDPDISGDDIFQASRNVWAMLSLQNMLGIRLELTPSIFAYSLLYPYSDNYLDDTTVSADEKKLFNERFGKRLAGESVSPQNKCEKIIFDLVRKIERQWNRKKFPQVFESLLAIHSAQIKSIDLLKSNKDIDVLGISFEKGGASVLADGYLIAGNLSEKQKLYLFGHGIWLQLVDDLQDVALDKKSGLMTVFSQISNPMHMEEIVNKTWHFGGKILELLNGFPGNQINTVLNLKRHSHELLFLDAINRAAKYLDRSYTENASMFFPFRFTRVQELRRKISKQDYSLMNLV